MDPQINYGIQVGSGTQQFTTTSVSFLPLLSKGVSTSAILLIQFFGDVDFYKYNNVP